MVDGIFHAHGHHHGNPRLGDTLVNGSVKWAEIGTVYVLADETKPADGEELTIPLDPRLDVKGNARKCFQKYRKGSVGQKYIREQLENTQENLNYFQLIQQQLEQADFLTATEIRQELENNGYMKARKTYGKKKKESEPHFLKIEYNNKFIYVGKNNIQNDYGQLSVGAAFEAGGQKRLRWLSVICSAEPAQTTAAMRRFCLTFRLYTRKRLTGSRESGSGRPRN